MTEETATDHGTEHTAQPDHAHVGLFRGLFHSVIEAARTGQIGDGRIFVLPVSEGYRIRTGEIEL